MIQVTPETIAADLKHSCRDEFEKEWKEVTGEITAMKPDSSELSEEDKAVLKKFAYDFFERGFLNGGSTTIKAFSQKVAEMQERIKNEQSEV